MWDTIYVLSIVLYEVDYEVVHWYITIGTPLLELYDRLYESRIQLQKVVSSGHQVPQPSVVPALSADAASARSSAASTAHILVESLLRLQVHRWLKRYSGLVFWYIAFNIINDMLPGWQYSYHRLLIFLKILWLSYYRV